MKIKLILSAITLFTLLSCVNIYAENVIKIKGHVKFNDPKYKMQIIKRDGFDKKILAEFDVDENNNYDYDFKVEEPGIYTLNCKTWEMVNFWAENEPIEINFRGLDTAKMKIKNPPYHPIENAGPKNRVMNELNFALYRKYQLSIGVSQTVYFTKIENTDVKRDLEKALYSMCDTDFYAKIDEIARANANQTSVVSLLQYMPKEKQEAFAKELLKSFPNYQPIKNIIKDLEERKMLADKMKPGNKAPSFSYPTPDGKKNLGPDNFKGKILVIDFWASWCGPCRKEIPHMKEIYPLYKDKGVEFLSVSLDSKRDAYDKALKEEKMAWPQVLAPNSGQEIMKEYQFNGIPFIILLDKEGKIVKIHLRGKEINEAIDELLAK